MIDTKTVDSKISANLIQMELDLLNRLKKLSIDKSKTHSKIPDEQSIELENDEVIDQLEVETTQELQQVKNALERIKQGKYHECTKCGLEISSERLEAIPYTTLCIACAEQ
jgi:RNA polymerase-binding transcription factor DksA